LFLLSVLAVSAAKADVLTGYPDKSAGNRVLPEASVGLLSIAGTTQCLGVLIHSDIVLTAAHCLFDSENHGQPIASRIIFSVRAQPNLGIIHREAVSAFVHPNFDKALHTKLRLVRSDLAMLRLDAPIRDGTNIVAGDTFDSLSDLNIVSFGQAARSCPLWGQDQDLLVMKCTLAKGYSGAPVFQTGPQGPKLVSIVSASAEISGETAVLGVSLPDDLGTLTDRLFAGPEYALGSSALRVAASDF
jgi:hypothetical protein